MAQDHDLFDDLIDISKGIGALKDPFAGVTDALVGAASPDAPHWNPSDYKERPRANTIPCLACRHEGTSCSACLDACPVDAISLEDGGIDVLDTCRKCGLCAAVCPTEAFVSPRIQPKKLYDAIARAAAAHDTAYVTCTRALRRMPRENEVVLACVGDVTPEVWFSILADYPNVSVYLPLDVCEKCRNTTGEEIMGEAIAKAEEWSGQGLGLEVDPKALTCTKKREYERKEFMDSIMRSTGLAVSRMNPATAALASVTQRLRAHTERITNLERTLNKACGTTTEKRRRILMQKNQLLLSTLQAHPKLAKNVEVSQPQCDYTKCTMCGECVRQCPTNACDLVGAAGRFTLEPTYCVGCGLCAEVCEDHALTMVTTDAQELIVPDPEEEARREEAERARQEALKAKAAAKKKISHALDKVEKLADE
ncbi:MAG: 4Fe-4S binding protein [Coriobacteriaceae bacterium]|nr:4Fe-4S binding protein [Coriobacteriaceae bacterium]